MLLELTNAAAPGGKILVNSEAIKLIEPTSAQSAVQGTKIVFDEGMVRVVTEPFSALQEALGAEVPGALQGKKKK